MVPAEFTTFFSVMAGVGATLFGLIFLVISIKPEVTHANDTSVMLQVQAASSYTALLNPLVISLLALMPQATINNVTLIMSLIGLTTTVVMGINLLLDSKNWIRKLRSALFIVASAAIYGYELFYAIRLSIVPTDTATFHNLADLLIVIYLYGITRAWELVGARQFRVPEMLTPLMPKSVKEIISDPPYADKIEDTSTRRD